MLMLFNLLRAKVDYFIKEIWKHRYLKIIQNIKENTFFTRENPSHFENAISNLSKTVNDISNCTPYKQHSVFLGIRIAFF
jgi:hypothetical protein